MTPKGQRSNKVIGGQPNGRVVAQRVAIDKLRCHQAFIQHEPHDASGIIDRGQSGNRPRRDAQQLFHILGFTKTYAATSYGSWQRLKVNTRFGRNGYQIIVPRLVL